jgi:RNA polymerase sigma factor (sigma-70 family)
MSNHRTVYLVDDDAAVRHALGTFLSSAGYSTMSFDSAEAFLESVDATASGILVLDQRMTGMTGVELQQVLAGHGIDLPVIFITGHGNVAISVMAMKAGATDFIEKPFSNEALLSSIQGAFRKLEAQQKEHDRKYAINRRYETLTPREKEILVYIVEGTSNKDLAERLQISNRTIEVHRSRIMHKMQADNLPDLVRMAVICDIGQ